MNKNLRNDYSREEIVAIYHTPLLQLIYNAAEVHKANHIVGELQVCTLLSIKTGGCTEDCSYCSQSIKYNTGLEVHALLNYDKVITKAKEAKDNGSTRFCMGAAWREIRDNRDFNKICEMVKGVNELGLEVCCTLGMLTQKQAQSLAEAGLYAYNHNLDTSESYYSNVITTRKYQDRLQTLEYVRNAGITVCCGGIIGLGETEEDRIDMLHTLSNLPEHPESVPINALVPIKGTPLEDSERVNVWEMIRMIATARILMPESMVRLSAGRKEMTTEQQALCFLAGANSIFAGEKLLTTPNPTNDTDMGMFQLLGIHPKKAFEMQEAL